MAWLVLVLAGFFEVGFTTAMKASHGFTRPWPSLAFVACSITSFALLTYAVRTIPLGSAYAVWTGLGAAGTLVVGILVFKEDPSPLRIAFVVLIIAAVIGVKLTTKETPPPTPASPASEQEREA